MGLCMWLKNILICIFSGCRYACVCVCIFPDCLLMFVYFSHQFGAEFRRFSLDRSKPGRFDEFYGLLQHVHRIPNVELLVGYADIHGDLLPINNDDNYHKAITTATPLLRLFLQRKGEDWLSGHRSKWCTFRDKIGSRWWGDCVYLGIFLILFRLVCSLTTHSEETHAMLKALVWFPAFHFWQNFIMWRAIILCGVLVVTSLSC